MTKEEKQEQFVKDFNDLLQRTITGKITHEEFKNELGISVEDALKSIRAEIQRRKNQ